MKQPRKTPTKEQKDWMKESGYTAVQLDEFWKDNISTNPLIRNLSQHGMTWRDMNLSCVMQLLTQKERDAKAMEEKLAKEQEEMAAEEKKKAEQEYYWEHFDEIMLAKMDAKEKLTEKEISELVFEYEIETYTGENRRWTRSNKTIIQLKERFFSIDWEEGLTEMQESEFYNQPIEVVKTEVTKTITVTEWSAI